MLNALLFQEENISVCLIKLFYVHYMACCIVIRIMESCIFYMQEARDNIGKCCSYFLTFTITWYPPSSFL